MTAPPIDPSQAIAPVVDGSIGAAAYWTVEHARELAEKFKKKHLGIIERKDTVQIATQQTKSGEYRTYRQYVKDPALRRLILAGLEMREMETDPAHEEDVAVIRDHIKSTYGIAALHAAEVAQAGVLSLLIGVTLPKVSSQEVIQHHVESILREVDRFVSFIKEDDVVERKTVEIDMQIVAGAPPLFIVLGQRRARMRAKQVVEALSPPLRERNYSVTVNDDGIRLIGIFRR